MPRRPSIAETQQGIQALFASVQEYLDALKSGMLEHIGPLEDLPFPPQADPPAPQPHSTPLRKNLEI